jgi:hypothetical protein
MVTVDVNVSALTVTMALLGEYPLLDDTVTVNIASPFPDKGVAVHQDSGRLTVQTVFD